MLPPKCWVPYYFIFYWLLTASQVLPGLHPPPPGPSAVAPPLPSFCRCYQNGRFILPIYRGYQYFPQNEATK